MKIYFKDNQIYSKQIGYTLDLVFNNKGLSWEYTSEKEHADFIIGTEQDVDLFIHIGFYNKVNNRLFTWKNHLAEDHFIRGDQGRIDHLASIFYLVNCIQEYDFSSDELDHYGRFPYEESLQCHFGIIERNLVQEIIDELFSLHPKLSRLPTKKQKTVYHLSHDIDYIFKPIKKEMKWAFKRLNPFLILKFIYAYIFRKPNWLSVEEIYKLHKSFGQTSNYFFISNNGKAKDGIENGDYSFSSPNIQNAIGFLLKNKQNVGLHKSTFEESIDAEAQKFNHTIDGNRNHYLKFTLPLFWDNLEDSQIKKDFSLGFGSKMGFRNSYGRAFSPYNFKTNKAYTFRVYPLNIMDSTFQYYSDSSPQECQKQILSFIDKHQYDCDLSVVWHNTSFTKYSFSEMRDIYISILEKISQSN